MKVKIKLLSKNALIPKKSKEGDFCYDLYAANDGVPCKDENGKDIPNTWHYDTDLAFEIVRDTESLGKVKINNDYNPEMGAYGTTFIDLEKSPLILDIDGRARSGIYKTGLILANCEMTVDEGFRGNVGANFYHVIPTLPRYKKGDRICQIKIGVTVPIEFEVVKELSETERGANGFGSTGRK